MAFSYSSKPIIQLLSAKCLVYLLFTLLVKINCLNDR